MSCQKEKRIDVLNLRSPEKVTLVFGKHEYDFSFLRNIMHPRLWPHKTVPFLYSACFRNKVRVFCMNLALELKEMPRNMYNFRFLDVLTFPYMCIYKKGNITEAYVSVKDRRENEFFFSKWIMKSALLLAFYLATIELRYVGRNPLFSII